MSTARLSPVRRTKCATCPFRPGSPYIHLASDLAMSALSEGSRECHSTGTEGFKGDTGKPARLCRGARDVQLEVYHGIGFISAATDAAWQAKCDEMGI